uniref:Uncharacterized protein n=1 Tax=viral metagenome TaxID=1070528 RepID=A0A6M3KIN4_9ZZZZ
MPTLKEHIEWLNDPFKDKDQHYALAVWSEDDVLERAAERGIHLSTEDARNIIDLVEDRQSADNGINWMLIDVVTDSYLEDKADAEAAEP